MANSENSLLGIKITPDTKKNILEKVSSWVGKNGEMKHIVSLNPENLVTAYDDEEFRLILQSGDVQLVDGFGLDLASKIRGKNVGERYTGVDFMEDVLGVLSNGSSRVLFLGGKPGLAAKLQECYEKKIPSMEFASISGIKDIKAYKSDVEGKEILAKVAAFKPHLIFAAFGSPFQEKFFWHNKSELKNTVCIGVGGAFDFLSGNVPRAPRLLRVSGLEWLFRLVVQPWRWRRQLNLIRFMALVLEGK
jgi:N-acetylglucosaminyldiphosphoundecaprenol N-acetyl-beta-D-mannosaminyltransferase